MGVTPSRLDRKTLAQCAAIVGATDLNCRKASEDGHPRTATSSQTDMARHGLSGGALAQVHLRRTRGARQGGPQCILVEGNVFWLKDKSLTDFDNLPWPDKLADEIIENLEAGLLIASARYWLPSIRPGRLLNV